MRYLSCSILLFLLWSPVAAQVPFSIQGPGVDPGDFEMTTFASGLNYPLGMVELEDGSILVGTSNGPSFFSSSSGWLIRLVDEDNDGVADLQSVVASVPGGSLSAVRKQGNLVFTTGQNREISVFRTGATPADSLDLIGSMVISYPGGWLHPHSALAVRPTPGQPDNVDLFFQVGSRSNFDMTTAQATLTSNLGVSGPLNGDSVYKVTISDDGVTTSATNLERIATGLRNAAGFVFDADGDLYVQDNGIDGVRVPIEPTSADELNFLAAGEIGGDIDDFGFPGNYIEYRTGNSIGGEGIQPLIAFLPIPDPQTGAEGEGPNDIALAPSLFPPGLNNGIFVGMHGQFSSGGLANEENPLVFVNLEDNSYFHFVSNDEPGVGHLDGLLATHDSLFVADISPGGGFGSGDSNTGAIYQIRSLVPEPTSFVLLAVAFLGLASLRRKAND